MSPRIFFIGDSFTNGTGDPTGLGWVGRVCTQAMTQKLGPVLMVESPPIADDDAANQRLIQLNQQLNELCDTLSILYIQTCQALIDNPTWIDEALASDGAHPGAEGYTALANVILSSEQWFEWLEQLYTVRS